MLQTPSEKQIVFFDGVCGICNFFVNFLIARDKKDLFRYAPLQGSSASSYGLSLKSTDYIVLIAEGRRYIQSAAVLKILTQLGGIWILFYLFYLIPGFLRDFLYRLFSKYRYLIAGKKEACRIPSPQERKKFLP